MKRFVIYGCLGWCLEIIWTGLGSLFTGDVCLTARTYLWMFPIYGLAILFEPVHDAISPQPLWVRGMLWMVLFFAVEYLTGWILRDTIGATPWDYSQHFFNIQGVIRLDYAPVWFVAGLLFEKIHNWLDQVRIYW
jgi:uncharacterized membrane protein